MDDPEQAPPADELVGDAKLRSLWLDVPDAEAERWHALSRARRDKVLRRLEALRQWEHADELGIGIEDVLATAGVNLSTFYAIRRRWADGRSLDSLGVYVRKRLAEGEAAPRRDGDVRARIERLLSANPDVPPAQVARDLAAAGMTLPKTTLLRLIRSVRADLPVKGPFGRMMTFDNAGADLVDVRGRRQRLCVVLDDDTGLVVGWAFVGEDDVDRGYAAAAEHALMDHGSSEVREEVMGGLADLDLAGVEIHGHVHSARFVGPPTGDPARDVRWRRLLDGRVHDTRFHRTDQDEASHLAAAIPGSRIVRALGDRIGPVWIGTGSREQGIGYRTGRRAECALASYELTTQIGRALRERNLHILGRMSRREDGWTDEAELKAIRGVLAIVAGARVG